MLRYWLDWSPQLDTLNLNYCLLSKEVGLSVGRSLKARERDEDADWRERMLWRWSGEDDDDDQFIQVCLLSTGQSDRTAHHPESVS